MSMTKKDFEGLATALRPLAIRQPYASAPALGPDVAGALVAFCKTQNPKFDAARFLAALAGEAQALPRALPGQEPTVTPGSGGSVSLRLTREQADALFLRLGGSTGDLNVPNNARVFRVYQALQGYFAKEVR